MAWRGSTSPTDRVFACIAYLLPVLDVLGFVGIPLLASGSFLAPLIGLIAQPLRPLLIFYYTTPFLPLAVFFALYLLVVRNETISHFIRFNAMQAILFGIVLSLFSILWQFALESIFTGTLVQDTLFNTIFLGTIVAVGYAIVQSALGRYAEIPTISEAAYTQVR